MDKIEHRIAPYHPRAGLLEKVRAALRLRRNRGKLALLDAHLLRDIGLTEDEARREAARPLWDAPGHWRG